VDTGLILGLIAAVTFAVGIVLVRKTAGEAGEAFTISAMSVFTGVPLFIIAITVNGGWHYLVNSPAKAIWLLAASGLIHFVIGRLSAYESWRLIGANRGTPITQISPAYTVILSWIFLGERLTVYVAIGTLCMLAGVFLISREKGSGESGKRKLNGDEVKGILLALVAALCWGITPVLIKPAVQETGSAVVGNLISYAAASIVMGLFLFAKKRRENFKRLSLKKNVLPMAVSGLFTAAGQLFYFAALSRSPANVIAPLISIEIVFVFLLSFVVNRKGEYFTLKVAAGMAAAVVGTFLLFR
jgi:drug/metabolite transporter (DMT)-like permease